MEHCQTTASAVFPPTSVGNSFRLINARIPLAVATGRGKSARQVLREVIPPRHWDRVVVGYYNGGDIGLLSEDKPDPAQRAGAALSEIAAALQTNPLSRSSSGAGSFGSRNSPSSRRDKKLADDVWAIVNETVQALQTPGTLALRSSHSIDVPRPTSR